MNSVKIDSTVFDSLDPDEFLSFFETEVLYSLELYAPLLTKKVSRTSNPWFTREFKMKCKERDEIYKRAK